MGQVAFTVLVVVTLVGFFLMGFVLGILYSRHLERVKYLGHTQNIDTDPHRNNW